MTASSLFLLLACVATAALAAPILHLGAAADDDNADPSFDHQTATYTVKFQPLMLTAGDGMTAMPYFSPDHSTDTQTALVQSAKVSIDIGNPEWDAWTYCSTPDTCTGCSASTTRADAFPMFAALLNALHSGVAVRILTNNYDTPDCEGSISPLSFLALNGAEVKYYTSTTFYHGKYMVVDGKVVDISSVNFTKTSFTQNREAGVVIEGGESSEIVKFTTSVFNLDWSLADSYTVNQTYSAEDMAIILDKTALPIVMPEPFSHKDAYITPKPTPIALSSATPVKIYTSPDFARTQLLETLGNATTSFNMMIYQVTDMTFCDNLYSLYTKLDKKVTLGVSYRIDSSYDCDAANLCYKYLEGKGMPVYLTPSYYTFSHNKFWIVDGTKVGWSTGNWSPSDYPTGTSFPPYGSSSWQDVNRDYTGEIESAAVADVFQTVMTNDLKDAYTWSSKYPVTCGTSN
eukprot:m.545520 g.545520  ORF g.545520 m.545520 type:complete len:459 (-) comp57673_c0_seq6:273-1649(-)